MMSTSSHGTGLTPRRGVAMIATLAIHMLVLLLFARVEAPVPLALPPSTALSVFDVPPPPIVESPPLPLPPPPPKHVASRVGGSPKRALTQPRAAPVAMPQPERRSELLAEITPMTSAGRPAPPDLMALPDMAVATGSGSERGGDDGRGNGRGNGKGGGGGDVPLARALWISIPTQRQIESYWPPRARRENVAGRVLLACTVPRPGPPRRCRVIEEFPTGYDFGIAALQMSPLFRIKPVMRGADVHSRQVMVPIAFNVAVEIKLPTLPKPK